MRVGVGKPSGLTDRAGGRSVRRAAPNSRSWRTGSTEAWSRSPAWRSAASGCASRCAGRSTCPPPAARSSPATTSASSTSCSSAWWGFSAAGWSGSWPRRASSGRRSSAGRCAGCGTSASTAPTGRAPSGRRSGPPASGEVVGVFPEATFSRNGTLRPFRRGAAAVAVWDQVPLVPVVVWGGQDVLSVRPWRFRLRRGVTVTVAVGEPLRPGSARRPRGRHRGAEGPHRGPAPSGGTTLRIGEPSLTR